MGAALDSPPSLTVMLQLEALRGTLVLKRTVIVFRLQGYGED